MRRTSRAATPPGRADTSSGRSAHAAGLPDRRSAAKWQQGRRTSRSRPRSRSWRRSRWAGACGLARGLLVAGVGRVGIDLVGAAWWGGLWLGRWRLSAVKVSCPACWGRWAGTRAWCWWWGMRGWGRPGLSGRGMVRAAAAGWWRCGGSACRWREALPLLPVAAALGELARLDGGGLLEAALDAAPGYVRGEVGRLLPGLGRGAAGPGAAGTRGGGGSGCSPAVAELLDAVAAQRAPGRGWWSRMCTGRTARRWIS